MSVRYILRFLFQIYANVYQQKKWFFAFVCFLFLFFRKDEIHGSVTLAWAETGLNYERVTLVITKGENMNKL